MGEASAVKYKVLFADDDPVVSKAAGAALSAAGFSVIHAYSGLETMEKVPQSRPDIVVMDVLLGDADGRTLCRRLREDASTRGIPVILISASKTEESDMVAGLKGGADDYLVKPLNPALLAAKVQAVLRRAHAPKELDPTLRRYGIELNVPERTVKLHGKEVALTRKEFDLLTALLRNERKVLSPNYLLETVWGYETEDYNDPRTVQVHVSRLKRKLGKAFASRLKSVIGSGYKLA
ncbi:MAG: response regulator transcription factor [Elusimicrobiota bacterium]